MDMASANKALGAETSPPSPASRRKETAGCEWRSGHLDEHVGQLLSGLTPSPAWPPAGA